jgi:tetratricopeptide (TPR) repeat protein
MAYIKRLPLYMGLYMGLLLISACGQHVVKASPPVQEPTEEQTQPADGAQVAANEESKPKLPNQPLTPELLFKFLIAEVAGQRGAIGVANSTYLDLARQTRDPRIARRAAEIAVFARDQDSALEATRLWVEVDQESERAQQTLASLLLSRGELSEAEPLLKAFLARDPANAFLHLSALMGKTRDTKATLELVQRLASDYPKLPEAQFAIAQAATHAGRFDEALAALDGAEKLRPGWETAALYRAQLLAKTSRSDALVFLRDFLVRYADAREVRLNYARMLVNANQFTEARTQFTRLTSDFPRNAEVSLAAGLLSLQMGDIEAAKVLLNETLEYDPRDPDTVHYYLGQVAEELKQPELANQHYEQVVEGNYLVRARARQAALLARQGRPEEARALLAATRGENEGQNIRLIQAEADLLRESREYLEVFALLSEALKRYPDSPDLLYDRAMAAEKLDRLDVLESDLRRVIQLRPDDAQAYNALGYTLADRTDRLAEAVVLLDKALALAPEDPFSLDSVGWAQYRSGNLARAQEFLERAFRVRQDPEIAAHLGEVLWARGMRDEAGVLWRSSLESNPHNEVLLETLRRLKP